MDCLGQGLKESLLHEVEWLIQDSSSITAHLISGIHNIVGAIYTTHLPIAAPKVNVASYFNKRHTERNKKTSYSITLQGTVDARGCFTDLCIGWPGSMSDDRVLMNSALYQRGCSGGLAGFWIVGSISYPLQSWLLVPYRPVESVTWAQHACNEKLEEIVRVARDAFARLKARWRFLQRRSEVKLQELPALLGACCVLHNICEQRGEATDLEHLHPVVDDIVPAECCSPWPPEARQMRDAIANQLFQQMQGWGAPAMGGVLG
eukprot:TRINITY_DN8592_c0_g3_i2.p2 TRINITY_DN8592_c0_g3~~TRINITY_DN8592_c0_g3_i2.p2  ORF type:complete len:262 (-),score=56.18 TRINITY_DN8592_c0_g3_i2:301-1086(-)